MNELCPICRKQHETDETQLGHVWYRTCPEVSEYEQMPIDLVIISPTTMGAIKKHKDSLAVLPAQPTIQYRTTQYLDEASRLHDVWRGEGHYSDVRIDFTMPNVEDTL